jgi:CRISPR-associated protein Cas5d
MALRRFRKGQYFHAPCLGNREFGANIALIEDGDIPQSQLTGHRDLGWMLYDMDYSDPDDIQPVFFQAIMQNGIIDLSQVELVR